jgi:hypothetical protein
MGLAINFSIVSGWFPTVVVTVAIVSVILAIGWWDGAWKMQLLLGIPISLALTGLVAICIHVFNLVPEAFPSTFYIWTWLMLFSLVVAVLGFRDAHWALRTFSVLAIAFCVIAAFTVVNETYDYYPTLERLFGKEAANFVALPELNAIRTQARDSGKLPSHGETIEIHIPNTLSKFQATDAYVWLPPVWFKSPEPALPVIEMISGVPGQSSDWTRASYADTTSTNFANKHGGMSPILVMPDANQDGRQRRDLRHPGHSQFHAQRIRRQDRVEVPRHRGVVRRRHVCHHDFAAQSESLLHFCGLLVLSGPDLSERQRTTDDPSALRNEGQLRRTQSAVSTGKEPISDCVGLVRVRRTGLGSRGRVANTP